MTQVTLSGIQLTRGTTPILRDVSLQIEAGEFCVFVGPSGCGKSTLLRLIAGLDTDAIGRIEIGGRDVASVPPAKRQVAMVFQGYALYPHMTVYDNMAFALKRAGAPKAEITARVNEAARILQLEPLLQRLPAKLSGGQRQRVAIGRAIVKQPQVFLFDEPLSNLDTALRGDTRLEIARLHRQLASASMLYVTHDQVEAMTLADRIVLLRPLAGSAPGEGSIVQVGTPMDLYHRPANLFAARFIGSPGMNLLPAQAGRGGSVSVLGHALQTTAASLAEGTPVTLGLRPEHVQLGCEGLPALVDHVEALGEHRVVHLTLADGSRLLAKSTDESLEPGQAVAVTAEPSRMHVFDLDGNALMR
jgi:multiple sugar transport system ATP-binding protein